ncbi:MAG: glycosyltransferase family 39 protein [Acidobacteria bacterium]|nr:glycosyltransferase family 39 protein [Acidobacteriota bacterium]
MNRQKTLIVIFYALGGILLLMTVLFSSSDYHHALLTDTSRSLSWGPTLFRVLLAVHGLALVSAGLVWRMSKALKGSDVAQSQKTPRMDYIILAVLTVIALGLRLYRLNTDLWFDEILMVLDFIRHPLGEVLTSFPSKNQHLLYSILAHTSVQWFGESAWAVRLPSVIFGTASVWALYLFGRHVFNRRVALFGSALLTLSYHHIWFSQNARGYMGLMLFTTLATWLWLEAWERGFGWWVAYAIVTAIGAWVHMTMIFVVSAHGLLYLVWLVLPKLFGGRRRLEGKQRWYPFLAWALCGTLTLQVYALALPEFFKTGIHEVSEPSEWVSLWWLVTESVRNLQLGFSAFVVLLAGGVTVLVGAWGLIRRDLMALGSMILPPVFAGVTTLLWSHNFWPRLFFFAMGFGLLIAVNGAMRLPLLLRRFVPADRLSDHSLEAAGASLVVLMIVASTLTIPRCYALPKQNYTGARDFVEGNRHNGDAVVAVGLAGVAYGKYFAPQWAAAQTEAELDAVRQGRSDVWLVYTIPIQVKAYRPDVWKVIEKDFEVVKVFPGTLGGGEVFVCKQKNKTELASGNEVK